MQKKAFRYLFFTAIIAVVLTGIIAITISRGAAINEAELGAEAMAKIIINVLDEDEPAFDEKAKDLGTELSYETYSPYRITIIAPDGVVLGDSEADINTMENHADRPEVAEALVNGKGTSRRASDTVKMDMLYVAVLDETSGRIVRVAMPLTEIHRMNSRLVLGGLLSILGGVLIAIWAAVVFAGRISRPISQMAEAAEAIADGNMCKRVDAGTRTELDDLAASFNRMSEKLDFSLNQLRHKNAEFDAVLSSMQNGLIAVDLDLDILYINTEAQTLFSYMPKEKSERLPLSVIVYQRPIVEGVLACLDKLETQQIEVRMGTDEIKDYRVLISPMQFRGKVSGAIILFDDVAHLLKLERLRSDFVANVSHELRTPLTSIKGYAETLKEEGIKDIDNAKRFLEVIEIEADRLNVLINDLMELSEIENKSEDVNISRHSLSSIIGEVTDLIAISAEKKAVEIIVDQPEPIDIWANRDRIKQLLLNLIDNGIKYNKPGGKVTVSVTKHVNILKILVKDTGSGIDEKDIPRLFERFYRVDKSRSKALGGTGLGLSIVKHICELYGGSVIVTSEKDVGSEFVVSLPIIVQ
ncbi:MAG: ATP-binding protein [Eubacteriales bacterium]